VVLEHPTITDSPKYFSKPLVDEIPAELVMNFLKATHVFSLNKMEVFPLFSF
jgi:hypothetical protein